MPQVVLDKTTGKDILYPDNITTDEIDRSMSDFKNGTLTEGHPSWFDKIGEQLHQNGVDLPNVPLMFKAAVGGSEEGVQPIIPFKIPKPTEQEKEYFKKLAPGSYVGGNILGAGASFIALEAATDGIGGAVAPLSGKVPALARIGSQWLKLKKSGSIAATATKTVERASKFGATMGEYGALSSASEQKDIYGDIHWDDVGKEAIKQASMGVVAGGALSFIAKPLKEIGVTDDLVKEFSKRAAVSGGVMATMAAANGGSPRDIALAGGYGMLLDTLHFHGEYEGMRNSVLEEHQNLQSRYMVSQLNIRDDIAQRLSQEHTMNVAEEVLQENQMISEGGPIHPETDLVNNIKNPIVEISKSKILTTKLIEKMASQVVLVEHPNADKELTLTEPTKRSGLASSVEDSAIKERLVKDFGDLPSYQKRNMDEVASKVSEFINNNYELAKKIAFGEAPEQDDLRAQELFTGIRIKAQAEGDVETLRELALNEKASAMATELGQRVKALDAGEQDEVSRIKELKEARQKELEKNSKPKNVSKSVKEIKESIKNSKPKIKDWNEFLEAIKC